MSGSNIISEFLMAIAFTVDGASERRASQSAKRVEAAVRQADASTTRAQVSGSNIRTLQANRELGIRTRGAAALIDDMKRQQAVEGATTVQVVRATRVRSVAHAEAATKSSRYNAAAVRFTQGLATTATLTTAAIVGTSATLATAAIGATKVIEKMADGFERLFYASQRTGASAGGLRSFGYAASQLGSSQQEAIGSLEAVASRIRRSPGFETMLRDLGVATHDANGNVLSFEKRILSLGRILARKPESQRYAYGDALGIDENTLRSMTSGEMEKAVADYEAMMAKAGLDPAKADKDSKAFMDVYRRLWAGVNIIATKIQGALVGSFGNQIEKLTTYLLDNADSISRGCIKIGEGILEMVKTGVQLVKAFNDLNPETKGFITQIGLLGAALLLFSSGPLGIITAVAAGIGLLFADYQKWKNGSKDGLIDWGKWGPALQKTLDFLSGDTGLIVAFTALGAVLLAKVLGPLASVMTLLTGLGAMKPAGWLLSLLGVGGGIAVAGGLAAAGVLAFGADHSKGVVHGGRPDINGNDLGLPGVDADGNGSAGPRKTPGQGGGQSYLRDLVNPKEGDTRSLRERLLPKLMGGKEAPSEEGSSPKLQSEGVAPSGQRGREQRVMARLIAHGWTPEAAATAVGQAVEESSVRSDGPLGDTKRFGTGDDAAHGMFQWRAERFRELKKFAETRGKEWTDFDTQVDFFNDETKRRRNPVERNWRNETDFAQGNKAGQSFEGYAGGLQPQREAHARRVHKDWQQAPAPLPQPEQAGTLPNGAPAVLKPLSMPNAPGVTMPEWRKKADAEAATFNQALGGGVGGVAPGLTMFNTTPLGINGNTDNSRSTTIRGGDTTLNITGVSDPKEAASLTSRTMKNRDADMLRNMKVSYA